MSTAQAAARTVLDNKPKGDQLKALMRGAFKAPDVTVLEKEEALDNQILAASEPAIVTAPVQATVEPAQSTVTETQTAEGQGAQENVVQLTQQSVEALAPQSQPDLTPAPTSMDAPPAPELTADSNFASEVDERPRGRAGRKPKSEKLTNMTLSLFEVDVEKILELSAYERLRLRRKVEQSEIVRELIRIGLTHVVDNKILPGQ